MNILSVDKKICTGCGACRAVCPVGAVSMAENGEGFAYPAVSDACIDCGLCYARCPAQFPKYENNPNPPCHAAAGADELRAQSSSGGLFTLLAEYVLERGGYVCGAAFTEEKTRVRHILISDRSQLSLLRGSKYMQSDTADCFKQIEAKLQEGALVLFVGCPCQVAGLKSSLKKEYETLLTADLVCHGVPPHTVFEKFASELSPRKIQSVNFRSKEKYGWTPTMRIRYKRGTEYYVPRWKCDYYKAFLSITACRKSCGDCRFNRLPRQGDFTLGDFWGIGETYPELDDKKGTSLVLLNTPRAEKIYAQLQGRLLFDRVVDVELARKANGNVFASSHENEDRTRFFRLLQTHSFAETMRRLNEKYFDVGIVGWWYGENYGSALTYYALHETVTDLGYDVLMLDWPLKSRPAEPQRDTFVRRFAAKHYSISARYTFAEYPSLNDHVGQFLVGSDQLWNYYDYRLLGTNYYMLDFADSAHKKIPYATSFGHPVYRATEALKKVQRGLLQSFDAVSVREEDGVRICREDLGVEAVQVCDPVFLCPSEKFLSLAAEARIEYGGAYLLAYILTPNAEKGKLLRRAAETLGLELMVILDGQTDTEENKRQLGLPEESVRTGVGIEEWLAYFSRASYVVTDSFHGTCFSIIFRKQFACLLNRARGISRFETLLSKLHLEGNAVERLEELFEKDVLHRPVDYSAVEPVLRAEAERSAAWLKAALAAKKKRQGESFPKKVYKLAKKFVPAPVKRVLKKILR